MEALCRHSPFVGYAAKNVMVSWGVSLLLFLPLEHIDGRGNHP